MTNIPGRGDPLPGSFWDYIFLATVPTDAYTTLGNKTFVRRTPHG